MSNKQRPVLDDGCCPELVAGAEFDLPLGIPIIKAPGKIIIPPGITPFSERDRAPSYNEAIINNKTTENVWGLKHYIKGGNRLEQFTKF